MSEQADETSEALSWFSDEALAKQAALAEKAARGEQTCVSDLLGLLAPRVQPTAEQRCHNCGLDGRPEVGGEQRFGKAWCHICLGRGRDGDYGAALYDSANPIPSSASPDLEPS